MVEISFHAHDEIRFAFFQVFESIQSGLEFDDIGDVEPLEDHLQQINVITIGLAVLIQEGIRPQVPRILVDERVFYRVYCRGVVLCLCRRWGEAEGKQQNEGFYHHRYPHPESRALSLTFRFYTNLTTTFLTDGLTDREPETCTLYVVIKLDKAFKHLLLVFLGNTRSCVLAINTDALILFSISHFDMSLLRVFDGIGYEIGDHLLDSAWVEVGGESIQRIVFDKLHLRVLYTFCN